MLVDLTVGSIAARTEKAMHRNTSNHMNNHTPNKKSQDLSQHAKVRRTGRGGMLDVADATAAVDVPEYAEGCSP
jgi:hypothetical protein